jgi:hypothetical protein
VLNGKFYIIEICNKINQGGNMSRYFILLAEKSGKDVEYSLEISMTKEDYEKSILAATTAGAEITCRGQYEDVSKGLTIFNYIERVNAGGRFNQSELERLLK